MEKSSRLCKSCHQPITDGHAYELGNDRWHVECFRCSKCDKTLGVNSNFLVLGTGALVCSDCSYTCKSCGMKIYDMAILTGDQAYCADCFKCKSCKKPIEDLKYARTSKGLFCMPCHHMLMEKKKKYEQMKRIKEGKLKDINDKEKNKENNVAATEKDLEFLARKKELDKKKQSLMKQNEFEIEKVDKKSRSSSASYQEGSNHHDHKNHVNNDHDHILNLIDSSSIDKSSATTDTAKSISTENVFDVNDYIDAHTMNGTESLNGSSIYTKTTSDIANKSENNSDLELRKVDSSPIHKLEVGIQPLEITSTPLQNNTRSPVIEGNFVGYKMDSIPILKPDNNNTDDDFDTTFSIPIRSPKRTAMSPVRKTAQFQTPELETPKQNSTPHTLPSPGSINRRGYILEEKLDQEPEPESFINLEDDEEDESDGVDLELSEDLVELGFGNEYEGEETIKSTTLANIQNTPTQISEKNKLMSPMKIKNQGTNNVIVNNGLNIKGLENEGSQDSVDFKHKKSPFKFGTNSNTSVNNPTSSASTRDAKNYPLSPSPEQKKNNQSNSGPNTNHSRKSSAGLGRSITKVFQRNRKSTNDPAGHTPEMPSSSKFESQERTPQRHTRTSSDHSAAIYKTPPLPMSSSFHTRSISETTTSDRIDQLSGAERELRMLKSEINSMTSTKATIMRDIQSLKTEKKTLEMDITDRQRKLKDLDSLIDIRHKSAYGTSTDSFTKVHGDDYVSVSSSTSTKNNFNSSNSNFQSREDLNPKFQIQQQQHESTSAQQVQSQSQSQLQSESESQSQSQIQSQIQSQTQPQPQTQTQLQSVSQSQILPQTQLQQQQKRSGFMRRLFGNNGNANNSHSYYSSASNYTSQPLAANISNPMNVRQGDEALQSMNLTGSVTNGKYTPGYGASLMSNSVSIHDEGGHGLSSIIKSRSTNFMQLRSSDSNNNSNNQYPITASITVEGKTSRLYSMSLQECTEYEGTSVPFIIKTCIVEVELRGSMSEGIYRVSGSTSAIEKIEIFFESLDVHNDVELAKVSSVLEGDVNAVAGMLKRYLKKLPDPLIPYRYYQAYIEISKIPDANGKMNKMKLLVREIPNANQHVLYYLIRHLNVIVDNERVTKMNFGSLATVFAPTLARDNGMNPQREILDNSSKTISTEFLFRNYQSIFDGMQLN